MITLWKHLGGNVLIDVLGSRPSGRRLATVTDDLRAGLDQLFLQARQRPVLYRLGRRQRA